MKSPRKKKTGRPGTIEREILQELTIGDCLYAFLLSARSTKRMYRPARERAAYRYRRKRAIERLIEKKYIERRNDNLSITKLGREKSGALADTTRKILNSATWDGKWRIVAFDIPQRHAHLRRKVRDVLKRAGFVRLQQSIWVFPHECEELAELIKEETRLGQYILYGVFDRIEDGGRMRKAFRL